MIHQQKYLFAFFGLLFVCAIIPSLKAQSDEDDDEGYGAQSGGQGSDADNYGGIYGGDDGYNSAPSYQQNNDADSGNNQNGYASQPSSQSSSSDPDSDYDGNDDSTAASEVQSTVALAPEAATINSQQVSMKSSPNSSATVKVLNRIKRSKHYIGPVYTYVKTDKHAHFKWGVKHKVGKKHHG